MPNNFHGSLQCHQRIRPLCFKPLKKRKDKGVSSLIGITLFIIFFTFALIYVFSWTQSNSNYANDIKAEIDFQQQRSGEILQVIATTPASNQTTIINIINPTAHLIVISQVWNSSHSFLNLNMSIPPFSNHNLLAVPSNDGQIKVVTYKGNIFYSTLQSAQSTPSNITKSGHWNVNFWVASTGNTSISVGNAIWYELSFNRVYGKAVTWGAQADNQTFGFIATTDVKLTNNANNINVTVSLVSPYETANSLTISLNNTSHTFANSGFFQFNNTYSNSSYLMSINFVNTAFSNYPQTIAVTIEGADFA